MGAALPPACTCPSAMLAQAKDKGSSCFVRDAGLKRLTSRPSAAKANREQPWILSGREQSNAGRAVVHSDLACHDIVTGMQTDSRTPALRSVTLFLAPH